MILFKVIPQSHVNLDRKATQKVHVFVETKCLYICFVWISTTGDFVMITNITIVSKNTDACLLAWYRWIFTLN